MEITEPGPHLDYMLQQTRIHHVQISMMADKKSNMLLTIAAVVITLSVRYLADPNLKWAALVLITFCLLTILLATYAVMPKIPFSIKPVSQQELNKPGFDLLFFVNFIRLEYKGFEAAMEEIMNDHNRIYQAQVREIYNIGTFLYKKKYRFLKLAYILFLSGLFSSILVVLLSGVLI